MKVFFINNMCKLKFLSKGLECYKATQMKACNILHNNFAISFLRNDVLESSLPAACKLLAYRTP